MSASRTRRRPRGSAWFWRQTGCWYYTPPGTKDRIPLLDEDGQRIRGDANRKAAELSLARVQVAGRWRPAPEPAPENAWLVAKVCSEYIQHCQRSAAAGTISADYRNEVARYLNSFCSYCGALPVAQLKKGHVNLWIESQETWRSLATHRNVIGIVLAAFNHAQQAHGVRNPINGLKKPPPQPRLYSFDADDEKAIYQATDQPFRDFLFAAIHTGLRPFCELARITADDVVESERGMMWRVYSSKTKKTRQVPVMRAVEEMAQRMMKTAPRGSEVALFRNSQGKPWKKVTGVARFLAIKRRLGWDQIALKKNYSCYTCRHTFAHRMLAGFWNGGVGCSIETLAELIGDTPKVAFDHYGREWGQHYQEPLWAAIGVEPNRTVATSKRRQDRKRRQVHGN
jgi:integrase